MKTITVVAMVLALAGCATTVPPIERTTTIEVRVPVIVPIPPPKEVVRPQLVIFSLVDRDNLDPGKVVQYYQASIKQLQGYAVELETIIDGYRQQSKATQP